jgi:hypothetical protein
MKIKRRRVTRVPKVTRVPRVPKVLLISKVAKALLVTRRNSEEAPEFHRGKLC